MSLFIRKPVIAVAALITALVAGGAATAGAASAAASSCGITWGSLAKAGGNANPSPPRVVRTGRHACYDRVVFELDGPATAYRVDYVPEVRTEGEGKLLAVAGGARLRVRLQTSVFDQLGHLHYDQAPGDHVAAVGDYRTLRDVVFAGCFEGQTTFGIGVRARLPFRAFTLAGPDWHSRIVVDVAHQW